MYGVNADVLLFQMFSGLRIGEVLGLRYRDLDLDNDYIYVNEAITKATLPVIAFLEFEHTKYSLALHLV